MLTRDDPYSLAVFRQVFVDRHYRSVERLTDVETIVDLGAHTGVFAVYAAALHPDARVICVEPHPDNFGLLRDNLRLNQVRCISVRAAAVGDGSVETTRLYGSWSSTAFSVLRGTATTAEYVEVPTITIDELCRQQAVARLDILKCDIEGLEGEVLATMRDEVLASVRLIVVEYHSREIRNRIVNLLEARFHIEEVMVGGSGEIGLLECTNRVAGGTVRGGLRSRTDGAGLRGGRVRPGMSTLDVASPRRSAKVSPENPPLAVSGVVAAGKGSQAIPKHQAGSRRTGGTAVGERRPLIATVVLHWNDYEDTRECLESVIQSQLTRYEHEIIVVDNASTDDSLNRVRSAFPQLTYVEEKANGGFARGNNAGIKLALVRGAEFILLLNQDVVLSSTCMETLAHFMQSDRRVGIAGCRVCFSGRPDVIWAAGGRINWLRGRFIGRGYGRLDSEMLFNRIADVGYVPGAVMMIGRDAVSRAGFLPECYFLGGEEADFAVQVRRSGLRVCYCPDRRAMAWHRVGYSGVVSAAYYYNRVRNSLLFRRRNLPRFVWKSIRHLELMLWKLRAFGPSMRREAMQGRRDLALLAFRDDETHESVTAAEFARVARRTGV